MKGKLVLRLSGKPSYILGALAGLIAQLGGDFKVAEVSHA